MASIIRIIGDCGHPWYVLPEELSEEVKAKPLKCPFCECPGATINELVEQMKATQRESRKENFKDRRRKKKNLIKKITKSRGEALKKQKPIEPTEPASKPNLQHLGAKDYKM